MRSIFGFWGFRVAGRGGSTRHETIHEPCFQSVQDLLRFRVMGSEASQGMVGHELAPGRSRPLDVSQAGASVAG